jgi:hypothetical protein
MNTVQKITLQNKKSDRLPDDQIKVVRVVVNGYKNTDR